MRRLIAIALALAAAGGLAVFLGAAGGGSDAPTYTVQLDNAFGLVQGADVKVAGVRAGKITSLDLDQRTRRALVGIRIDKTGFGSLRRDVFCETRPQSLIGEYFIDCQPGTSRTELKSGSVIPVERTASTIAPDLVQDIMRLPYRQRLRLIINELGAGVAGRSQDLNAAIRRAVPALRETDRVLAILAPQNKILADLATNGDKVLHALAVNRRNVGRFVEEANRAAQASASRNRDLAETFHRFPGFLEELRPAMRALGEAAAAQTPALRNLDASARRLTRFFDDLGNLSDASRPAFKTLGQASAAGRRAVTAAPPIVDELAKTAKPTPELGKNLAIVLRHIDDRNNAVERDPRAPDPKGYTGLEALLQYIFWQSQSTNIFDGDSYKLKIDLFHSDDCSPYADLERAKSKSKIDSSKTVADVCGAFLGPDQQGLTTPDPSAPGSPHAVRERASAAPGAAAPGQPGAPGQQGDGSGEAAPGQTAPPIDLGRTLDQLLGGLGDKALPKPGGSGRRGAGGSQALLDFLLAP